MGIDLAELNMLIEDFLGRLFVFLSEVFQLISDLFGNLLGGTPF